MTKTMNQTTAIIPSSLGAPACGHAFASAFGGATTSRATGLVVRERSNAFDMGDLAIAPADVPGSHAWSPPIC